MFIILGLGDDLLFICKFDIKMAKQILQSKTDIITIFKKYKLLKGVRHYSCKKNDKLEKYLHYM